MTVARSCPTSSSTARCTTRCGIPRTPGSAARLGGRRRADPRQAVSGMAAYLRRMRYALNLPIGGPSAHPRRLAEFAALAEDSGWDAVFVEDYIVYQNRQDVPTYDPWVALAAMALATSRVRLGTMVTPLARRRPWKLAREAVTLDHLSGGRVILGVGLGDTTDTTFAGFGEETDLATRAAMTDEALEVLAGLWTGEPFSYEGRHYCVDEV